MLGLTADDVKACIDMTRAIEASAEAFTIATSGGALVPVRHQIPLSEDSVGFFMPGYIAELPALGLKIGCMCFSNLKRGLPSTFCTIVLIDPVTGLTLSFIEATWLTNLKTGAGTGVATDLLARPDCTTHAVLGTGAIAYHQVEGVLAVRPSIDRVILWNRTTKKAHELAAELKSNLDEGVAFEVSESAEAAVRAADIVTTCTASPDPVVKGEWVRPGTHVNLTGAHGSDMREGDDELLRRTSVRSVDMLDAASVSGELKLPIEAGVATRESFVEIGQILTGSAPRRTDDDEITWYKSGGIAAQDLTTGKAVYEQARARGLGTDIDLDRSLATAQSA